MCLRDLIEYFTCNSACSQREPWNECDAVGVAEIHDKVPFSIGKAISILYGDDWNDLARPFDVLPCNVRQSDEANLPLASELSQSFHRSIEIHYRIRRVQLIHIDPIQTQSFEAAFYRFAKMSRSCVMGPLIRPRTIPSALGCNDQSF